MIPANWLQLEDDHGPRTAYIPADAVQSMSIESDGEAAFLIVYGPGIEGARLWFRTAERALGALASIARTRDAARGVVVAKQRVRRNCPVWEIGAESVPPRYGPCVPSCGGCGGKSDQHGQWWEEV